MRILRVVPLLLPFMVAGPLYAQGEEPLRDAFEGRMVTVRLDMPATSKGIDIRPQERRPLDAREYADRLKDFGTAVRAGTSIMVTKVRVKKDLIEFQLGGGGYGTFGDESGSVSSPSVGKSARERNLEKDLKDEKDAGKRRTMQEELDKLRKDRANQEALVQATTAAAEAANKARVREKALAAGSRFNLRFEPAVPPEALTPDGLRRALAQFVDFGDGVAAAPGAPGPAPVSLAAPGAATGTLRKGLTEAEVDAILGRPTSLLPRTEGTLKVVRATYSQGDNEVTAEFVEGVLIRYSISSR